MSSNTSKAIAIVGRGIGSVGGKAVAIGAIECISVSISRPLANNSQGRESLGGPSLIGATSRVTSDSSVSIGSIGGIGIGGIGSIESISISVSRPLSNDPGTVEGAGESRGRVARPVGVGIVEARVSVACIAVAGVEGVSISLWGSLGIRGSLSISLSLSISSMSNTSNSDWSGMSNSNGVSCNTGSNNLKQSF